MADNNNNDEKNKKQSAAPLKSIPQSKLARAAKLTGLSASVGLSSLGSRISRSFQSKEEATRSLAITRIKQAQQIVKTLSEMKGAAMKLGQVLSLHGEHLFPKEVTDILATLQADSKYMAFSEIEKIIIEELGRDYRQRLLDFSEEPIAAASIGQVHKACLEDGTWVAVKVQYPGVATSIDSDVEALASLIRVAAQLPTGENFTPVIEEIKQVLKRETDYSEEAKELAFFSKYFAERKEPNVVFPQIYKELSTKRVLTTKLYKGQSVREYGESDATAEHRTTVGTAFLRVFYHELFRLGRLQTDPNFGNYRILPDTNTLVCLDYGAVRQFDDDWRELYIKMIRAAFEGDRQNLLERSYELDFLRPDDSEEAKDLHVELCNMFLEPFQVPGAYDFHKSDLPARMRSMIPKVIAAFHFRAPPREIIFLNRKMVGTYFFLSAIKAKINVGPLLEEFL